MRSIDELCKKKSIYPNVSFGKNFASLTVFIDGEEISASENDFSKKIDEIFEQI